MEADDIILTSFILTIKQSFRDKKIPTDNPMIIITKCMELLEHVKGLNGKEKKIYTVKAIEAVAKGDDGIFGTADDLIPERTIRALQTLVEQDIIDDTVQLIIDTTKGKYDINKTQKTLTSIITTLISCFKRN